MSYLLTETNGPVASLTFNRPERANALDTAWLPEMTDFFREIENDAAVRCVLLRGNGKHFMAGGDLGTIETALSMPADEKAAFLAEPIHAYNQMIAVLRRMQKPIVASVQGGVAGAAVGLVAACDLVVAADDTFFFVPHAMHGGAIDGLTTYFLPRHIGIRKTMEMALLGDRVKATEAQRLGLINFLVSRDALDDETNKLTERLASGPTKAYGLIRNEILSSLENSLDEQASLEAESYAQSGLTADWSEGINAFLEKREPRFKGE